jgi:hypothetical protein
MADSTGLILIAAGLTAANEAIFIPATTGKPLWKDFNWRIVPATAVAVMALAALEKVSPPLGKGLAGLALLSALMVPLGNAPSPIDNLAKMLGIKT